MIKPLLVIFTCVYSLAFGQYCVSGVGPTSNADSNVELVQLSGVVGNINYTGCPGVIGVQDLTLLSTTLNAGAPYVLNVKFGTCGGNYAGVGEAWIDFDQNGNFDAYESLGTWSGTPPVAMSVFNFIVPSNAQNGATRMRIMQREAGTLPLNPCGTYSWGSVMDFGITIGNGIDCTGFIGDDLNDPILVSSLPFTDTRDNSFCYSNNNYVYPSPDIYYKFVPNPLMHSVHASLCGASFDTFLSVIDINGNVIAFNDDGANCGNQSELTMETAGLGTIYFIVEGWGMEMGNYTLTLNADYVGLSEENLDPITLFPNPSNGLVSLNRSIGKVSLYHVDGTQLAHFNTNESLQLDLSEFDAGSYFLRSEDGQIVQQLILVK
ncbi:MAG: GEVED domain-containing protein [Flavobacteriales bacterium]